MVRSYKCVWLIEQWARWARIDRGAPNHYPSMTPVRQLLGSTLPSPLIEDNLALSIDLAVARLKSTHHNAGRVIILYFLIGLDADQVADAMHENRVRVDRWLNSGVRWIGVSLKNEGS